MRSSRHPTASTATTSTPWSRRAATPITTVGFLLGDATLAAAKANKDVDFSIVDFAYEKAPKNLKGLVFNTAEPSYLAGYLAAAKSESGTVGTFGGLNIPTVTSFMTGFMQGIEKYNEDNGADVQLLGWDGTDGSFTEDFEDKTKGQAVAEQMIQQGADVIFPVAGPAGLGGLQAAQDADVKAIWVDTDGCVSAAEYCDVLLTSVVKGMDVAVTEAIAESLDGTFTNELYVGTLENDGVGLAPYAEGEVDDELAASHRGPEGADHRGGHHHRLTSTPVRHAAGAGSVPRPGFVVLVSTHAPRPGDREEPHEAGGRVKLEIRGLTRRFGTFTANDKIDLVGRAGPDPLPAR